jgi:hypothetical protein
MARFSTTGGSGDGTPGAPGAPGEDGADGKDSLFLGTWNSVTEFLAAYQGGPVGLADGDWWAFVKDNTNPNKIYVVREDPNSATGWVIDDNEHFVLPQGTAGADGNDGADGAQGPQGDPGSPGLVYLGNYVSGNGYIANLAVVKGSDNNLYIAKANGGLADPVGNTAEWDIFSTNTKTSGSWTVTTGTNTYNFTLPSEGTYTMWVNGNIPNGIILWNATVSVSNNNVPAIGSQYAWNYTSGGSPILLTAIPNQIRGVAGTINTDATYTGNSSNRFDFTIANTSGASRTVYYGYTKI